MNIISHPFQGFWKTQGLGRPLRKRQRNSASNKRKLLNVNIRLLIRLPIPTSNLATILQRQGSSHPLNEKFRETPTNVPIPKGRHKSPDDGGAVEEDVQHMEREGTRFDAPHIVLPTYFLVMTPSFYSRHARPPRSSRLVICAVRPMRGLTHLVRRKWPRAASVWVTISTGR
ncbi:hypothetical protein V8E53_009807, partial [Lactarius tabidus]